MPLYGGSSGENSKYREMLISVWMVAGVSWCRPSLSPGDRFYILAVPGLRSWSTTAIIFICCAELSAVPVWTLGHRPCEYIGFIIVREHLFVTERLGNKEEGSFPVEHSFRALSVKMLRFIRVILNFHCASLNFHFCG